VPAVHQILEPLPAIAPGLAHDAPVVEVEHVEEDERHRTVGSPSLGLTFPQSVLVRADEVIQ
jgi:hypothetical protein